MSTITWGTVGTVMNLLTTEMNNLANNSGTAYGPEVGASSGTPQTGVFHFHIASSSLAFTTASNVIIMLVPSITLAGTNYPTYTSGASPIFANQNYLPNILYINPTTQSSNVVDETMFPVLIPPGKFKTILINQSGFQLPASGNTLDLYPVPGLIT